MSEIRKQLIELIENEEISESEIVFILQFLKRIHQQA